MATKDRVTAAQVADRLRERIAAGEFGPGDQLPSSRTLRAKTGAAAATVDQAIQILKNEGLLVGRHGIGTFVRRTRRFRRRLIEELRIEYERALSGDDSEGLIEAFLGADVQVESAHKRRPATGDLADHLAVPVGAPLLLRCFRYVVDGEPMQIARFYMPADIAAAAGLPEAERKGIGSLVHLRNGGVDPDRATFTILIRRPTTEETADLAIPAGTSVAERTRTIYAGQRPVEFSRSVVAADQIEFFLDVPLKGDPS